MANPATVTNELVPKDRVNIRKARLRKYIDTHLVPKDREVKMGN